MIITFRSHANNTHFHEKGFALRLVLKVRVFGNWKWPIARKEGFNFRKSFAF